jgi:hypothetical protein
MEARSLPASASSLSCRSAKSTRRFQAKRRRNEASVHGKGAIWAGICAADFRVAASASRADPKPPRRPLAESTRNAIQGIHNASSAGKAITHARTPPAGEIAPQAAAI